MGGDPSLPLCMRYQGIKGSTGPVMGGDPLGPLYVFTQEEPLMGGDPSLPLCMRYEGSRESTVGRGAPRTITRGGRSALLCI